MTNNFVHIGMAKTGTTFLQNVIFKSHEDVSYFGKNSNLEHINLVGKSIFTPNKKVFNAENAKYIYQQHVNSSGARCFLYSEEILSSYLYAQPLLMAERLLMVMGDFHPILMIREPGDWLESMYFFRLNNLKQDSVFGFEKWLDYNSNSGTKSDIYSLNYGVTAEIYRVASQQNKISVLFYEDFKSDREKFLLELSEILSIDSARSLELANRHIPSVLKDKLRINTKQAEFLWSCSFLYLGDAKQFQKVIDEQLKNLNPKSVGEVANQARDLFDSKSLCISAWMPTIKRITRLLESEGSPIARLNLSSELRDNLARNARKQQIICPAISDEKCKEWRYY